MNTSLSLVFPLPKEETTFKSAVIGGIISMERKKRSMSVLNIDGKSELQFQTQALVGRSIAVLGITGSGKTNTSAVLIEEFLLNSLPLTIVDIEGEYWGLKEKFEVLVVGRSPHSELEIGLGNASQVAEISVQRSISVILDLSDFSQDEIYEILVRYFTSLWTACSSARRPYQIVLEEAHEFVPQGIGTPLKQILTRIALRGRKRGLGIILVSQRSAKVEKDVLTQASMLFLHKVVHPIDLKIYKDLIPLPSSDVDGLVRRLQSGEAIVIHNNQVSVVYIRVRYTFHAGSTPTYEATIQPKLRKLDEATLRELQTLIANANDNQVTSADDERARLTKRVKDLEEVLALKEVEIYRLQSQVDLLSKLSISIEKGPNSSFVSSLQTLKVDQATVQSVITGGKLNGANVSTDMSSISSRDYTLSFIEQRKLDSLKRRIQKLPKLQRSILRLLIEHEGTAMTIPMMATWLSLKETTIRSRPPFDLIKMKLVTRTRGGHGYRYTSSISSYLRTEFPQIEPSILIEWLFVQNTVGRT